MAPSSFGYTFPSSKGTPRADSAREKADKIDSDYKAKVAKNKADKAKKAAASTKKTTSKQAVPPIPGRSVAFASLTGQAASAHPFSGALLNSTFDKTPYLNKKKKKS